MAVSRPRRKIRGPCPPADGLQARAVTEAPAVQGKEELARPILFTANAGRQPRAPAAAVAEQEDVAAPEAKVAVEAGGGAGLPASAATSPLRPGPRKTSAAGPARREA